MHRGSNYFATSAEQMGLVDKLPTGVYQVQFSVTEGFYLAKAESFEMPSQFYGDVKKQAARILNTFSERDRSTGVLLTGVKGSGKTLLAKYLSHLAEENNVPTILVNSPFTGDQFNAFLQGITQPVVVLLDEFEKVYDDDQQQRLLSTLDGIYSTRKLFILTSNEVHKVNENMRNRPGRLYYMITFDGLDNDFVREYCERNLNNQKYTNIIGLIRTQFYSFSFDMLQALVEETNRYDESPYELIKLLNLKMIFEMAKEFDVIVKGNKTYLPTKIRTKPLTQETAFSVYYQNGLDSDGDEKIETELFTITPDHIVKYDQDEETFTYKIKDVIITLTRVKVKTYYMGDPSTAGW